MGIVMKKTMLTVATLLAMGAGAAQAADLAYKVPPAPVYVSPCDVAFGASIMSDYLFRGVTQSNHKPAVSMYIEPRYNINPNLQIYAGLGGASIDFTNKAAAEIDIYAGIRPTFGPVSFDFGAWYYWYPGGECIGLAPNCPVGLTTVPNGNVMKKDVSFFEVYGKVAWTINDMFTVGASAFYSPDFLNTGADGTYIGATAKFTGPTLAAGIGWYVSGELGQQFLGTSDAFYGLAPIYPLGIPYADYTTWNVGIGFTCKVFTLDLRYSGTNLSKGECNAFTSDFTAGPGVDFAGGINTGVVSNWCDDRFVAKLSFDTTLNALK
jgi:uncharacterized protein (TIGR02001 family)